MNMRRIAGFGLWAALAGAQPGCARQLTNSEVALGAVSVAFIAGVMVLNARQGNCDLRGTCPAPPIAGPDARAPGRAPTR
jgi:hypothetical protein